MYTWEIEKILRDFNYDLPSNIYLDICENSSQITYIKYDDFSKKFMICVNDSSKNFVFKVHKN